MLGVWSYLSICFVVEVQRICWVALSKSVLQRYLSIRAIKLCDGTKKGALETPSVSFEILISDLRRGWFVRKSCWALITAWSSLACILHALFFFLSKLEELVSYSSLEQLQMWLWPRCQELDWSCCCVCRAELLTSDVLSCFCGRFVSQLLAFTIFTQKTKPENQQLYCGVCLFLEEKCSAYTHASCSLGELPCWVTVWFLTCFLSWVELGLSGLVWRRKVQVCLRSQGDRMWWSQLRLKWIFYRCLDRVAVMTGKPHLEKIQQLIKREEILWHEQIYYGRTFFSTKIVTN